MELFSHHDNLVDHLPFYSVRNGSSFDMRPKMCHIPVQTLHLLSLYSGALFNTLSQYFLCLMDFDDSVSRRSITAKSILITDKFPSSTQLYNVFVEGRFSNLSLLFATPAASSGVHLSSKNFSSAKLMNVHTVITV